MMYFMLVWGSSCYFLVHYGTFSEVPHGSQYYFKVHHGKPIVFTFVILALPTLAQSLTAFEAPPPAQY